MNTFLTHGAIRCVCGERKCTFSTTTVTQMLHECYMVFRSHKNRSATTTSQHQKQSFANSPIQVEIVIKIDHSIHNHKIPTNDAAYKYKMEERDRRKQMINEKFSIIIWQFIFGWKNFFIFSRIEAFGKKSVIFPPNNAKHLVLME